MINPSSPLRLAAISFLNAAPLMRGLETDKRFELVEGTPAECAERLQHGQADLGVVPVLEVARMRTLVGLEGMGVAARRQVRSILLLCRKAPAQVGSVALDPASRTSAALAQILLSRRWGARYRVVEAKPEWRANLAAADATLVIGDPALQISVRGTGEDGLDVYDLATEWHAWTGLPFIFALWGVRQPAWESARTWLGERLAAALRQGRSEQEELVATWSQRLALPADAVRHYLEHDVEYELGADHKAGLERFLNFAAEAGLLHTASLPTWTEGAAGQL